MSDRPILFSSPMVLALLAGVKTQTRRAIKPRGHASLFDGSWADSYVLDPGNAEWRERELRIAVGDRLYVREHWRTVGMAGQGDSIPPRDLEPQAIWYEADGPPPLNEFAGKLRIGMHMPRWASRLTLTVTDVRVQRLQDISDEDAMAEGVIRRREGDWVVDGIDVDKVIRPRAKQTYAALWNLINGPNSWDTNPWVAAYSFTVAHGNIGEPAHDH